MLCQNILVNVLVHPLEHLSFQLRCPSFWLSKFASQLKLFKSVGGGQGIRNLWHKFNSHGPASQILGLRVTSPKSKGPSSRVLGIRVLCLRTRRSRVSRPRVSGSQDSGSQGLLSQSPWSRVSGPDYRLRPGKHLY